MSIKPVVPSALASKDVDDAIDNYLAIAGENAALRFIDALEQAYRHISRHPASGSPRYGHELDFPGMRSCPLLRLPYLVFYAERDDRIDIWRVLHGKSDIPTSMQEPV